VSDRADKSPLHRAFDMRASLIQFSPKKVHNWQPAINKHVGLASADESASYGVTVHRVKVAFSEWLHRLYKLL
jgi:hypothetical protein